VNYLDKSEIIKSAKQFKTKMAWRKSSREADLQYQKAWRKGWLDEACAHMVSTRKSWTFKRAKTIAVKYKNRQEFRLNEAACYMWLHRKGLLDKACSHMPKDRKVKKVSKSEVLKAAKTCVGRKEFATKYPTEYRKARLNGWLDEACSHMDPICPSVYSFTKFKEACDRGDGLGEIYVAFFEDSQTGEKFGKIGITSRTVGKRYSNGRSRANYDIVEYFSWRGDPKLVWDTENHIKQNLEPYKPSRFFAGCSTECFITGSLRERLRHTFWEMQS